MCGLTRGLLAGKTLAVSAAAAAAAAALLGVGGQAQGATAYYWATAANGDFGTNTNWSPNGVPTSGDAANFAVAGTYTVNFTGAAASQSLNPSAGDITFNLNGNTYTQGSTISDYTFVDGGTLHISDGTLASQRSYVGYYSASTATLSGSTSHWTSVASMTIGAQAAGTLSLTNGATGSSDGVNVSSVGAGGNGTFTLDNSTWTSSTNVMAGESGSTGLVQVLNGGTLTQTGGHLFLAYSAGSGTALISGTSSTLSTGGGIYVGGSSGSAGGTGLLDIEQGGSATALSGMNVWNAGTVKLKSGSINVGSGTITSTGGTFEVSELTNTVTGNLTLDSASTTKMHLASSSIHGNLNVINALSFAGTLDVVLDGGYQPAGGDSYDLFDWGSNTGTFTTLNLPALNPGLSWDTTQLYSTGIISVVPEPTSLGILAAGGLLALRRRRR